MTTIPGSSPNLISSPGVFLPSSPLSTQSSESLFTSMMSPRFAVSPLAASSPRQPHPPPYTPHISIEVPPAYTPTMRQISGNSGAFGMRAAGNQGTATQPLNLTNDLPSKPVTSTTTSAGIAKPIATQVLKVSLIEGPEQCDKENRGKSKITLSVPLAHGFNFSKGQILKLSDGKAYNIDEVQAVMKETIPLNPEVNRPVTGFTPTRLQSTSHPSVTK
ncbi:uncharacterized protein [Amphiura filiformis]|uniref:uncharacterized protein n=1 Tax=Amphiura filiformis TaxID=82378 RepID=UPI003B216B6A